MLVSKNIFHTESIIMLMTTIKRVIITGVSTERLNFLLDIMEIPPFESAYRYYFIVKLILLQV